jgi:hypothetical protein
VCREHLFLHILQNHPEIHSARLPGLDQSVAGVTTLRIGWIAELELEASFHCRQ